MYGQGQFPASYKNVAPGVRSKAVSILNAILRDGKMDEGAAIATALTKAREFTNNSADQDAVIIASNPGKYLCFANAIRGVEIFSSGKHNGDPYTEADLDGIVAAFNEIDFKPALKVGHTKDYPGAPAYGWVEGLRREGKKLVADFTDMHDGVVDAIRKRNFDRLSSELYENYNRAGKQFKHVLKAVSLLGAEVPAVPNLTPLHKVQFTDEADGRTLTHSENLQVTEDALVACYQERLDLTTKLYHHQKEIAMNITELMASIKECTEKVAALAASNDPTKTKELADVSGRLKTLTEQAEALRRAESERVTREAQTTKQLQDQAEEIARLNAINRDRDVKERTAKVTIPALRPAMAALYTHVLANPDAKVKVYTEGKDKQVTTTEQSLVEVVDGMVGVLNEQGAKLFSKLTVDTKHIDEQNRKDEGDAGAELDRKTKEYMAQHNVKNYIDAQVAVCEANPELAQRYNDQRRTAAQKAH